MCHSRKQSNKCQSSRIQSGSIWLTGTLERPYCSSCFSGVPSARFSQGNRRSAEKPTRACRRRQNQAPACLPASSFLSFLLPSLPPSFSFLSLCPFNFVKPDSHSPGWPHYVTENVILNSRLLCLYLQSAGVTGMHEQGWVVALIFPSSKEGCQLWVPFHVTGEIPLKVARDFSTQMLSLGTVTP